MRYRTTIDSHVFTFEDLKQVMACASPARSGDYLAGIGAATAQQRMAARHVLADTPLAQFLSEALVPYDRGDLVNRIHQEGEIDVLEHTAEGTHVTGRANPDLAGELAAYAV